MHLLRGSLVMNTRHVAHSSTLLECMQGDVVGDVKCLLSLNECYHCHRCVRPQTRHLQSDHKTLIRHQGFSMRGRRRSWWITLTADAWYWHVLCSGWRGCLLMRWGKYEGFALFCIPVITVFSNYWVQKITELKAWMIHMVRTRNVCVLLCPSH